MIAACAPLFTRLLSNVGVPVKVSRDLPQLNLNFTWLPSGLETVPLKTTMLSLVLPPSARAVIPSDRYWLIAVGILGVVRVMLSPGLLVGLKVPLLMKLPPYLR